MAQYDGSIRINTKIETKQAQINLSTLENRIVKTSDKIASLRSKMDSLKDAKIPTQEYQNLQKELDKATQELEKMVAQDSKLADIDAKIKSLSQSSAEYAAKMKEVAEQKIPTQEYTVAQKEVDKYSSSLQKAKEKIDKLLEIGVDKKSSRFVSAQYDVAQLENKLLDAEEVVKRLEQEGKTFTLGVDAEQYRNLSEKYEKVNTELEKQKALHSEIAQKQADTVQKTIELKTQMNQLVEEGKDFTLGQDTEEFSKLSQQLQYAENDLEVLNQKHEVLELKQEKAAEGYKRLGSVAKQSFNSIGKVLTKANFYVNSFGKRLNDIAKKILPTFHKETKRTNTVLGQFSTRLKSLLSGIFIFNVISSNIRKMFSGINEGFENFYNQNSTFKSSVDNMRVSLLQLKNSLTAAFAPIVSVAIPYLEKLISYITKAVNSIGQLIAALLGKKTYIRAIRTSVGGLEDTADAFEEVKESAKDAEKAIEGYLSPLDEINKYSEDKEIKIDIDTGKRPDASDIGDTIEDMFEEVPIDSYFLDLANKVKDIFSQLFAPLKEAWNREGKFVMDSWKYALGEVWDLIKSIGSDFLEVWQQEKTIKIFEDLLHIIGDIGLVVGNLAHNFRLAWEENETGKRILEGIRDIIGVIVANIRHAADVTVEWSKNLNFAPLLTKVQGWIESLVPVFDNLSGIITDFYEKVLLPLGKWTIEKGLPELLQVFIDFNNKVDWETLRSRLAQFWEHLEPFAETVGEGLIIFIERCANALADFINSPAFDNFLTMIENWMDSVKPEDVADALEAIAKSIATLKASLIVWKALEGPIKLFGSFISMISGAKTAKALKNLAEGGKAAKGLKDIGEAAEGIGGAAKAAGEMTTIGEAAGELAVPLDNALLSMGAFGVGWQTLQQMTKNREHTAGLESFREILKTLKQQLDDGTISAEEYEEKVNKFNSALGNVKTAEDFNAVLEEMRQSLDTAGGSMEKLGEKADETGSRIAEGLTSGMEDADVETSAQGFFDRIVSSIKSIFGIHSPAENMKPLGKNILLGVVEGFTEHIQEFNARIQEWCDTSVSPWFTVEKWSGLWEGIKTAFSIKWGELVEWWNNSTLVTWWNESVAPWFTIEKWKELFENIKTSLKEVWDNTVGQWATDISEWWEEHVAPWFTQEKWEEILNSVPEAFSNAFTKVVDTVKEKIQPLIDWIIEKVEWMKSKIEDVKEKFSSIKSRTSSFIGVGAGSILGGSSIFGRGVSYSLSSPAMASLPNMEIPKLATGAVIPANREFLAVLGDQKHGTNVEAPLETIKQANRESLLEVLSELGVTGSRGNEKGNTYNIKALAHSKVLFELMIEEGKMQQMSTGNNPFLLGTT